MKPFEEVKSDPSFLFLEAMVVDIMKKCKKILDHDQWSMFMEHDEEKHFQINVAQQSFLQYEALQLVLGMVATKQRSALL